MRRLITLLVALAAVAAAGKLNPVTILPADEPVPYSENITRPGTRTGQADGFIVGYVDTIGGTTYDWQANGPMGRFLVNSTEYGLHALWMYSASNQTTFPDRNMRYNFFDYSVSDWNWIDPDFMQSGVNVFTDRSGYGTLDRDPVTGVAQVVAHLGSVLRMDAARDMAPGAGLFEYCSGEPTVEGYLWPYISTGNTGVTHAACIDDASRNMLFYSRVDPWCTWANPVGLAAPQPDPEFPTQNIAASKVSEKVAVAWEYSAGAPDPGFYRISTDGGASWGSSTELPWPPAFGGDSLTSYHITSMSVFYDREDELHIVVNVMPFVGGSGYIIPAQLWHWNPDNSPNWSHIHTATCNPANLGAAVGYNAMYACRPSIGEDDRGMLYVAWEQFDSSNVEPGPPELLRADIFFAQDDGSNGQNWSPATKITDRGTGSHRFPSIVDYLDNDTLCIVYMIDQRAGFFVQGEGPATNNPVIAHWVPLTTGIGEGGRAPARLDLEASPNPFRARTELRFALPRAGDVRLEVFDLGGREVARFDAGLRPAGYHSVNWQAYGLSAGVYVARLRAGDDVLTRRLVLVD